MTNTSSSLHCIYVSKDSTENFITGLNEGIWGLKSLNPKSSKFKIGDYLLFAYKLSGNNIRQTFKGQLNQYVLTKITSNVYKVNKHQDNNNPKVWANEIGENLYLHRFHFKILNSYPELIKTEESFILQNKSFPAGSDNKFHPIYAAFRYSTCVQGTNGAIESISLKMNENNIENSLLKDPENIFDLSTAIIKKNNTSKYFEGKIYKPRSGLKKLDIQAETELDEDLNEIYNTETDATTKSSMVLCRIGQGTFRKKVLKKFNEACLLTNIRHTSLLIASHIKPWKESNNEERLDVRNGLLLSSLMDRLFDRYFITFDPETLQLVACEDNFISKIIEDHNLNNFTLKVPYKGNDLNIFKSYMSSHFNKFKEINE